MVPNTFKVKVAALFEFLRAGNVAGAAQLCEIVGLDLKRQVLLDKSNYGDMDYFFVNEIEHTFNKPLRNESARGIAKVFRANFSGIKALHPAIIELLCFAGEFSMADSVARDFGIEMKISDLLAASSSKVEGATVFAARKIREVYPGNAHAFLRMIIGDAQNVSDVEDAVESLGLLDDFTANPASFFNGYSISGGRMISPALWLYFCEKGATLTSRAIREMRFCVGVISEEDTQKLVRLTPTKEIFDYLRNRPELVEAASEIVATRVNVIIQASLDHLVAKGFSAVLVDLFIKSQSIKMAEMAQIDIARLDKNFRVKLLDDILHGHIGKSADDRTHTIRWLRLVKTWGEDFSSLRKVNRELVNTLLSISG